MKLLTALVLALLFVSANVYAAPPGWSARGHNTLQGVQVQRGNDGKIEGCAVIFSLAGISQLRSVVTISGNITVWKSGYVSVKAAGTFYTWGASSDSQLIQTLVKNDLVPVEEIAYATNKGFTQLEILQVLMPILELENKFGTEFQIKSMAFRKPAAFPLKSFPGENFPFTLHGYKFDEGLAVMSAIMDGDESVTVYVEPSTGGSAEFVARRGRSSPQILGDRVKVMEQFGSCTDELQRALR